MNHILLCIFVALVIIALADYDNPSPVQFAALTLAFAGYLLFLSGNKMSNLPPPFDKYLALPAKIKDMLGKEFDQYQAIFKGMKDVAGNPPNEVNVDGTTLGPLTGDALSNVQEEYFDIDRVFRDLLIADSNLYLQKVFLAGAP